MKPLTTIAFLLIVALYSLCKAQTLNFDSLNSSTVLDLYKQGILTTPPSSEIIVQQIGNNNYSETKTNRNTELQILQSGDYNYLYFNNTFDTTPARSTITAEGNNNIIDVTGTNSISDKMQIHIKGDNKTIFVRNY